MKYTNLRYLENRRLLHGFDLLPLFYVLPKPLVYSRKMDKFPRNPFEAATSPEWWELYRSTGWQAEVIDMWALTIWPYLGIRGGISNYSFRDPFVLLACTPALWTGLLAYVGVSLDVLARFPDDGEAPYKSEEDTDIMCKDLAKLFWNHPNLKMKEIWEIIKEHRVHEDFSERTSTVHIDFLRKYYHSRTKYKHITIDLDEIDGEHEQVPEENFDIDNVIGNDWINKFYGWLGNKRDIEICKLLYIGRTQQEIAKHLGYHGNSGVAKRVAYIREILEAFVAWQIDLEDASRSDSPASTIRYDEIDFSYQRKIL